MPRDVTTRWNSTYDMLEFAIRYRLAIDKITGERTVDPATGKSTSELRILELDEGEWTIMGQLADVLKVCRRMPVLVALICSSGSETCHIVLLAGDAKPGKGYPRHGPYRQGPIQRLTRQ